MGIPVVDTSTIYTLIFADEQVVIAQDIEEIEYMTRKLRNMKGQVERLVCKK